jgi:hypothetical protein
MITSRLSAFHIAAFLLAFSGSVGCPSTIETPLTIPVAYSDVCGTLPACGLSEDRFAPVKQAMLVGTDHAVYVGIVDDHENAGAFIYADGAPCAPLTAEDFEIKTVRTGTWTISTSARTELVLTLTAKLAEALPEVTKAAGEAELRALVESTVDQTAEFSTERIQLNRPARIRLNNACKAKLVDENRVRSGVAILTLSGSTKETTKSKLEAKLKAEAKFNVGLFDTEGKLTAEASKGLDSALNATISKNRWIIAVGWYDEIKYE